MEEKGYVFFDDGIYNLNLFGVRSANREQAADRFDDVIGVAYKSREDGWLLEAFEATVDPGVAHMTQPVFDAAIKDGTAILAPGQYRGVYQLGTHGRGNWRHEALQQVRPIKIYRDRNRDTTLDMLSYATTDGLYGINLHAASLWRDVEHIGRYSAGCQVVRRPEDFRRLIALCKKQYRHRGWNTFTYTLLDEKDIAAWL